MIAYGGFFQDWLAAASVMIVMALAWVNFRWLGAAIEGILLGSNPKKIKYLVFKFLLRLLLILGILYVMIRVSLVAAGGLLLGLSMYVLAIMVEAVLSLVFWARN
ncbi:MAG: hypothetical protein HYX74_09410 [Acidobacteria bacterium]|nr:hypothetical protein [Acidobacteriota bacterium]